MAVPPRRPPPVPPRGAPDAGDARLAWLGTDEPERRGGISRAWPIVAALLVLALLAGGGWYVSRRHAALAPIADGAIVRAPAAPYKVRPARAGGSLAEGTGDTSYAVAEGKPAPRVVLAEGDGAPAEVAATAPASGSPGATAAAGVPVQVGAFPDAAQAEAQWPKLVARYPPLAALGHRVVASRADLGAVSGLQAIAGDREAALALCAALRHGGLACQVRD